MSDFVKKVFKKCIKSRNYKWKIKAGRPTRTANTKRQRDYNAMHQDFPNSDGDKERKTVSSTVCPSCTGDIEDFRHILGVCPKDIPVGCSVGKNNQKRSHSFDSIETFRSDPLNLNTDWNARIESFQINTRASGTVDVPVTPMIVSHGPSTSHTKSTPKRRRNKRKRSSCNTSLNIPRCSTAPLSKLPNPAIGTDDVPATPMIFSHGQSTSRLTSTPKRRRNKRPRSLCNTSLNIPYCSTASLSKLSNPAIGTVDVPVTPMIFSHGPSASHTKSTPKRRRNKRQRSLCNTSLNISCGSTAPISKLSNPASGTVAVPVTPMIFSQGPSTSHTKSTPKRRRNKRQRSSCDTSLNIPHCSTAPLSKLSNKASGTVDIPVTPSIFSPGPSTSDAKSTPKWRRNESPRSASNSSFVTGVNSSVQLSKLSCPGSFLQRNNPDLLISLNTPVGVFWDIENVSVPRALSASSVVEKLREVFCVHHKEKIFMASCVSSRLADSVLDELNASHVLVASVASGKNKADHKLIHEMNKYKSEHPPPAVIVLLTGDVDFDEFLDKSLAQNYYVVLVHPQQTSNILMEKQVSEVIPFVSLIKGVPKKETWRSLDVILRP